MWRKELVFWSQLLIRLIKIKEPKTNIDLLNYCVLFCLPYLTARGRIAKSCIFSENQILILIWRLWNSLKQKVQEQKWKLRVIPFIWVQYFTNRSIFRGSFHNLFTNVNKSATAKMVEILTIFSKHKMISENRQYVWPLKFLTHHINSWF